MAVIRQYCRYCGVGATRVLLLFLGIVGASNAVRGQEPPPTPAPTTPPPSGVTASTTPPVVGVPTTADDLAQRLRETELANRRLAEQMQVLLDEVHELKRQMAGQPSAPAAAPAGGTAGTASRPSDGAAGVAPVGSGANVGGAPDRPGGRLSPVPSYSGVSGARAEKKTPLNANFGPGFELLTEDGEYQLQVHSELQVDYKEFDPNGDDFARSGFVIPRARLFFNGRVGKPYEYFLSLNRGFGAIDLLDAYGNLHPNDEFQIKIGRFMTPFNYEQFAVQNMWLWAPERSLFTANLGANRQIGAQVWGNVFKKRVDYALGVFDGHRNSFEDFNESKDVMAYLNIRPFGDQEEGSLLRNLNIGGSASYGAQDNPAIRAFRTASNVSNASTADAFSPPFLILDPAVRERGQRTFWSAHAAYFYKSFSLFADYNGAVLRYVRNEDTANSTIVPASGYSVAAGYFLTGETMERRTAVEPLKPFSLKKGEWAPGAWEVIARYSTMELDRSVFDQDLADPDRWSNRAWILNLGLNWHMNRYIKWYIDWQHTEFGDPVIYQNDPERKQITNQLLWLRMQIYF